MRFVVCLKPVIDPEISPNAFSIDEAGMRPDVNDDVALVMDSYAANALETGLQLRRQIPGSKLTVLCVGDESADEVLRQAYELTVDEVVRVWDSAWAGAGGGDRIPGTEASGSGLDAVGTASVLAQAIDAIGGADLVLCGREAGDVEQGLVGPALAEALGAACLTLVESVTVADSREVARVTRLEPQGLATWELPLPAVVTMTSTKDNVLRLARVKDKMLARRKRIRVLESLDSVPISGSGAQAQLVQLQLAQSTGHGQCEMIEGEDGPDQARELIERLRALKVL